MHHMVSSFLGRERSCNVFCSIILEALKVVWMLLKNPREGQKMKRRYEENIGLHEVFLEAVPSVFITTILLFKVKGKILRNLTT